MLRAASCALLCLLPLCALADEAVLTLEQALNMALTDNPAVQSAQLKTEAVGDEISAMRAQRLPQLDVSGGVSEHLTEQSYEFDQGVWGSYPAIGPIPAQDVDITSIDGATSFLSADVIQPLSQQYEIGLGIEQGEVKQDMAKQQVRMVRQDLAALVKRHYYDILRIQGDLTSTEESVIFYRSLDTLVNQYVDQKIELEYQLLDVQARLARKQMDTVVQRNKLETQKQQMNKLLGRGLNTPFDVARLPSPSSLHIDLDNATNKALQQRPDVLGSKMRVKSAELGYDLKKAEYIPEVELLLRYSKLYGHEFVPDKEAYVGLHAKWEIYDWGRKRKQLSGKDAEIQMASNHVRQVEQKARIAVDRSYRSIGESIGFVEVARLSQTAAQDKLRVLMNQYREQSALLKDVLDAESELASANAEHNRAVLGVWQAQAEFNRAIGEI